MRQTVRLALRQDALRTTQGNYILRTQDNESPSMSPASSDYLGWLVHDRHEIWIIRRFGEASRVRSELPALRTLPCCPAHILIDAWSTGFGECIEGLE